MASKTHDFPMTTGEQEQKPPQASDDSKATADTWHEFVDNTTLHGIRYVFIKRHILIRLVWLVVLLTAGGYYIFTVYKACDKYYSRPINTVLSTKHLNKMDFPAVTICPLTFFARSKIFMTDDDPLFESRGLNSSSCAVTSAIRGNRPCGLAMLCCFMSLPESVVLPNCTSQYRHDLLAALKHSGHGTDAEELYRTYSQDINALVGPRCYFGRLSEKCSAKDFVPKLTLLGMCYTFNAGTDGKVKTVDSRGNLNGFRIILDAQTHDYYIGKISTGFKVIVHKQGEHIDTWGGANIGPGLHAAIALSQKQFVNLKKPYATNCSMKTLKTFSTYTLEGCFFECWAENVVKACKCRPPGYKGYLGFPACTSGEETKCAYKIHASLNYEVCDCQVHCTETKYNTEISYSRFPETDFARGLVSDDYYTNEKDQRENLVFLEVGFKSLSYELQEQQPAYDIISLFGEIGGNIGLFLGCSLLTICEFFDFLFRFLAARKREINNPA